MPFDYHFYCVKLKHVYILLSSESFLLHPFKEIRLWITPKGINVPTTHAQHEYKFDGLIQKSITHSENNPIDSRLDGATWWPPYHIQYIDFISLKLCRHLLYRVWWGLSFEFLFNNFAFTCCCAGHFDDAFRFTSDFPGVEGSHPNSHLYGWHGFAALPVQGHFVAL